MFHVDWYMKSAQILIGNAVLQAEYMQSAKAYAFETQLSKRVSEWQAKLAPILEAEVCCQAERCSVPVAQHVHCCMNTGEASRIRHPSGTLHVLLRFSHSSSYAYSCVFLRCSTAIVF